MCVCVCVCVYTDASTLVSGLTQGTNLDASYVHVGSSSTHKGSALGLANACDMKNINYHNNGERPLESRLCVQYLLCGHLMRMHNRCAHLTPRLHRNRYMHAA